MVVDYSAEDRVYKDYIKRHKRRRSVYRNPYALPCRTGGLTIFSALQLSEIYQD